MGLINDNRYIKINYENSYVKNDEMFISTTEYDSYGTRMREKQAIKDRLRYLDILKSEYELKSQELKDYIVVNNIKKINRDSNCVNLMKYNNELTSLIMLIEGYTEVDISKYYNASAILKLIPDFNIWYSNIKTIPKINRVETVKYDKVSAINHSSFYNALKQIYPNSLDALEDSELVDNKEQ